LTIVPFFSYASEEPPAQIQFTGRRRNRNRPDLLL
jgi:hypothetical protein